MQTNPKVFISCLISLQLKEKLRNRFGEIFNNLANTYQADVFTVLDIYGNYKTSRPKSRDTEDHYQMECQ